MASSDFRYLDYIKAVMRQIEQRFGVAMFEERHDVGSGEQELRRLYDKRIPPHLAAEALVTGNQPIPSSVRIERGTKEWSALVSVCELARARVAHIEEELTSAGATEGHVIDILKELASHVETLDRIVNRFDGYMPSKTGM
jgi:hypothetical protein